MTEKFRHSGTGRIETSRLVLRPFIPGDAQAMYENWANDPLVTKFLTWPAHENLQTSVAVLRQWTAGYAKDGFYQWAIVLKDTAQPICSISVVENCEKVLSMLIGYCIGRKWWRQGITSEALAAVMRYLFETTNVNRIEARHDPNNPNSGLVMRKCGMLYEGTMRSADLNNQGICDYALYAILRSDC
jgi:ribosomal-protein-alanine N-acetyltransferase